MKNILASAVALLLASTAVHAGTMASTPLFPTATDTVSLVLRDEKWPTYLPTASYTRSGNVFTFDFDLKRDAGRGDLGTMPIAVGQLPPGTYTTHARVTSLDDPAAQPTLQTTYFTVSPPWTVGAYSAPTQPTAYNAWNAIVTSAYHLYPASLKVRVSPPFVRVSFDYEPNAPTGPGSGAGPAGTMGWAALAMAGLAPGNYTLEFNGTPRGGNAATLQYSTPLTVLRHSVVVEYYNDTTGHYFISGGPGEVAGLDAPGSGWRRTGEQFHAFLGNVPAGSVPVCRFYASGPHSHFYTADGGECDNLKSIEQRERAGGKAYSGWIYEGIAFHAMLPANGACPSGTDPVNRFYNNRWQQNDSNHRFPVTSAMRTAMMFTSWTNEGIAFCSPK